MLIQKAQFVFLVLVTAPFDAEGILMQQAVVMPTQQYQIIQTGLATVAPVFDVVGIYITGLASAGMSATAVPDLERAPNRRRHGTGLAANV